MSISATSISESMPTLPKDKTLFVVVLRYLAPLDAILETRPLHVDFLQKHFDNDTFLVSGPQIPRTGGVIIAKCQSREMLMTILHQDPFYTNGLAEYQIFEFMVNMYADKLKNIV